MKTQTSAPHFLRYFILLMLVWFICACLCCFFCNSKEEDKKVAAPTKVIPPVETQHTVSHVPFSVDVSQLGGAVDLNLEDSEGFKFAKNAASYQSPIPVPLMRNLDVVKNFMSQNEQYRLTVKGLYSTQEQNSTAFPNLGLARANQVKGLLSERGFDMKRVNMIAEVTEQAVPNAQGVYEQMTNFSLHRITAAWLVNENAELNTIQKTLRAKPLILRFASGESVINLTETQRQTVLQLVKFLDKNKDAKAHVIGHTDNDGRAENNLALGKQRAEFVKQYLISNGLSDDRIVVTSRGQTQPIASNETDKGKAENRRVVVTLY